MHALRVTPPPILRGLTNDNRLTGTPAVDIGRLLRYGMRWAVLASSDMGHWAHSPLHLFSPLHFGAAQYESGSGRLSLQTF